jgi:hypothetical protein
MQNLLVKFILLPESAIFALSYGFIILGAVACHYLTRAPGPMGRATYFILFAVSLLATSFMGAGWLMVPAAVEDGYFVAYTILLIALYPVFGFFSYLLGSARSVDINGDRKYAYMALVPILNLYLIFASGQKNAVSATRKWFINPALVFGGIIFLAFSSIITKTVNDTQDSYSSANTYPAFSKLVSSTAGLEEILKISARQIDAPTQIDEVTRLVSVSVLADTFTYHYQLADAANLSSLPDGFDDQVRRNICGPDVMGDVIDLGAIIVHDYVSTSGSPIDRIITNLSECRRLGF